MPAYYLEAFTVTLGLVLLLAEAFFPARKGKAWVGIAGAIGLAGILASAFLTIGPEGNPTANWASWPMWNFYQFDSLARFFKIFSLLTTIFVLLMAVDYRSILARFTDHPESENGTGEFYCLPIFACAGMMWIASARDLATAFVALELVTVTFYILVAFMRRNIGSLEAGVKYLIIGALSTGFLVYGIAWIYGSLGTMTFDGLASALHSPGTLHTTPLLFGIALVLIGLGFKVGAVPTHIWIPDVYQGAPTPTTAFLSVGSKAAGFVLLIRFIEPFLDGFSPVRHEVTGILAILATATLLFGNFAAIPQTNFKRLLGYSSIAHAGFLLLALAAWQPESINSLGSSKSVAFYLATYLLMTLAVFFVLGQVRVQRQGEAIADFNGLGKSNPRLATVMTVLLAALAGVPLTAGFVGKFLVFDLARNAHFWCPLIIGCIGAAAGFYYYFKIIRAMWWIEPDSSAATIVLPRITQISLIMLTAAVIIIGIYPEPIYALLR
ncbi:NADH-quinone oxidoreductase subunit N [Luteolibacter pohnpeiensis]|uniref:NADH-quinone oxidoreductase subunit N n=1 Tax=Luteolibacter pohnpeiensis TaxID=454153 RepID=A0A934SDZ3_9BACT|nr:NADH-quinone oxidoreductase subunit N [Luteolibacter pohnpeiensis]MBK1884367.1 NADH-quinone oxidoreductase subunit N [Luteolibacter pohnpeiensis]